MKKDIYIFGSSGFGREVAWLIEELPDWNILGFIDDDESKIGEIINGYLVLGNTDYLLSVNGKINVVIAIGNPTVREIIVQKLSVSNNVLFPNIIANNVRISKYIELGIGNIICSQSVLTTNIKIGDFNHVNLNCTIGHDVVLSDYITIYPSVNVSGNVEICNLVEVGTGTRIIQGKKITSGVILGAGSVVVKDIMEHGTYVGVPVKKVK